VAAPGENPNQLSVRLYFSPDTYISITFEVKNSRHYIKEGVHYMIYGCSIEHADPSFHVYKKFIDFLKIYSENAEKDVGDTKVSYL
jgi:hypothetical protein